MILDTLSGTDLWKSYYVLIFNSYHWWLHSGRLKTWDRYQIGNSTIQDMDVMEAYKTALTTWANWVDSNIDPTRTVSSSKGFQLACRTAGDRQSPLKGQLTRESASWRCSGEERAEQHGQTCNSARHTSADSAEEGRPSINVCWRRARLQPLVSCWCS